MKKLWGGRFEKDTDELVEIFTESVSYDQRLYRQDIEASLAHADMLCRCNLVSDDELAHIRGALEEIRALIETGRFTFQVPLEDVHMNIEAALIERIGDVGRKLHTARSRNDQIATDVRLWCRDAVDRLADLLADCQSALVRKADEYKDAPVPGFTHLQHAQPVLLGHSLLAWVEKFGRDAARLADTRKRINVCPLGACALAGTTLPTDPPSTAAALGFDEVFSNSIDAVSDRDFLIELVFDLSMVTMHLSRMCEEWIIWSSQPYDFVDLDESYCTGSSIMPQKKNPDVLELVRGKCARVYGHLTTLLTMFKGLPLAYNRDMQEDKEALFDAVDTVELSLRVMTGLVETMAFKRDHAAASCAAGHTDATALADYLVLRGMPFRQAHEVVGRAVRTAVSSDVALSELSLEQFQAFSDLIGADVYGALGTQNCIEAYRSHGSSAPSEVLRQIEKWRGLLGDA